MIYFRNFQKKHGCMKPVKTLAAYYLTTLNKNYSLSYAQNQMKRLSKYTRGGISDTTASACLSDCMTATGGRNSTDSLEQYRTAYPITMRQKMSRNMTRRYTGVHCRRLTLHRQPKNLTVLSGTSERCGKFTQRIFLCLKSAAPQK